FAASIAYWGHRDDGNAAHVVDLGAGVGTVGLCLAKRLRDVTVDLAEREPELTAFARQNVARNDLSDRVRVLDCDLTLKSAANVLETGVYDHVVANPPFYAAGSARPSATALKSVAHILGAGELEMWARCMARVLRPSGHITIIHSAHAVDALIGVLARRFGNIKVVPVFARADHKPAIRCLVTAQKGSRAPLQIGQGLILHGDGHAFRKDVSWVLKEPATLDVWPRT
ncbi:MAG: methyltransferase, partial [Pseudomonadota bacterium]